MPIIDHREYDRDNLENVFVKDGGKPLRGELDIYRRLCADCERHHLHWHMWHSLRLAIPVRNQQEIEIDFLLLCESGAIIIEVKGGLVECRNGVYYLVSPEEQSRIRLERTPFEQANDYKHALIRNHILDRSVFITTACAFPHTQNLECPNEINNFERLWDKTKQDDPYESIADFLDGIITRDREKYGRNPLSEIELEIAVNALLPNINDPQRYSDENINEFLNMIKVSNSETLDSLRKNRQLVIEGKPGTGKTTIAKMYVAKHSNLRGVYFCWNKLLVSVMEEMFQRAGLRNCEVYQYRSFLQRKDPNHLYIKENDDFWSHGNVSDAVSQLVDALRSQNFRKYDYVIVDESQDIFDKGIVHILEGLTSVKRDLRSANFLLFYDNEQGYRADERGLDEFAEEISNNSAHFILNDNKRVQYNKSIVKYAEKIYSVDSLSSLLTQIANDANSSITINRFNNCDDLIQEIYSIQEKIREDNACSDAILLLSSAIDRMMIPGESMRLLGGITATGVKLLNEDNVCSVKDRLYCTTMLKYKGLECKRVILVIEESEDFFDAVGKFELYVGMTRAIAELRILVLNEVE